MPAENSARSPGRPFAKGQSGNPGGRPKTIGPIRDLAREHTVEAFETLIAVSRDEAAPHSARVAAANSILDRGWGKPSQPLDGDGEGGPIGISISVIDAAKLPASERKQLRHIVNVAEGRGDGASED